MAMREDSKAAPRSTLAERMAQARERIVASHRERNSRSSTQPDLALASAPAAWAAPTQPMEFLQMQALDSTTAPMPSDPWSSQPAAPRTVRGHQRPALPWSVSARPGETVTLLPGQMHFGGYAACVRTLLGSCVAVTLWHPLRRIGGMCHYLLPARHRHPDEPPDGKYGDEALEVMVQALLAAGTQPAEYTAHLYGGADTMPGTSGVKLNVGERNIEQGWHLIDHYGFQLQGVDVGEDVPRTVSLTLSTGAVSMRRGTGTASGLALSASPAQQAAQPFPRRN